MLMKSKPQVPTSQTHTAWLDCPMHRQTTEQHPANRILSTDQAKHGNPVCVFPYTFMTNDGFTTNAEPEKIIIKTCYYTRIFLHNN